MGEWEGHGVGSEGGWAAGDKYFKLSIKSVWNSYESKKFQLQYKSKHA